MSDFDKLPHSPEFTRKQIKELLSKADLWATEILNDERKRLASNPDFAGAPASTSKMHEDGALGFLQIENIPQSSGYVFDYTVESADPAADKTIQRFTLQQTGESGNYELMATERMHDLLPAGTLAAHEEDSDFNVIAYAAAEKHYNDALKPASPLQIQTFMELLELARFGDQPFDFDGFDLELFHHIQMQSYEDDPEDDPDKNAE